MRVGAIVEGLGDRKAFPTLVTKTALVFGSPAYVVHVIECGGWGALKRAGGLERFCRLMRVSADIDRIICAADLDDGCPAEASQEISQRRDALSESLGIPIDVCLLNREYETWFLQDLEGIKARSPDVEWSENYAVANPMDIRDAKGAFSRSLRFSYRPSIDQERFTKRLDLQALLPQSRSLRKLACSVTELGHDDVLALL